MSDAMIVTVRTHGQQFGLPVMAVQDIIKLSNLTPVPLAPDWVAGVINLRGRIVTAIDLGARLGFAARGEGGGMLCAVVEVAGEHYALLVDAAGDVLPIDPERVEPCPPTMVSAWKPMATGVLRGEVLTVLLDAAALVAPPEPARAAA